jgi:AraC family transcriptional regulator of adaptative response/methylated-DNA-[protein]-cysteine methyltransferase
MITSSIIPLENGTMTACAVEDGICLLEFSSRKNLSDEFSYLEKYFKSTIKEGENKHIEILKLQLDEYFGGTRKEFTIPFIAPGTKFQQTVWQMLLKIPYGNTISYLELATSLGNTLAVRAVAMANSNNRIAIIIPCHRVVGTNGRLIGYSGGLDRKRWLLDLERQHSGRPNELSLF